MRFAGVGLLQWLLIFLLYFCRYGKGFQPIEGFQNFHEILDMYSRCGCDFDSPPLQLMHSCIAMHLLHICRTPPLSGHFRGTF